MKIILTTLLLVTLFLVGCTDTPISPVKSENHSYQLIKLPKKSNLAVENSYSVTQTIDGAQGGIVRLDESYVAQDGHTVYIDVKLTISHDAFPGVVDITITADDDYAAVQFSPEMTFDIPLQLDLTFIGLDLDSLNLTTGDYDFVFIDEEGNIETIGYNAIHVTEDQGKLWVTHADIPHFSRYGFIN